MTVKNYRRYLLVALMAIAAGSILALFSWLVKPLPWKYTFNYNYLPGAIVAYLDNPESLRLIPLTVLAAFEAMFIYAFISPLAAVLLLISIIPILNIRFVAAYMNIYLPAIFLLAVFTAVLGRNFLKRERPLIRMRAVDIWGLIFLFYFVCSLGRSHHFKAGLKEIFSLIMLFTAYFTMRFSVWDKEKNLKISKWLAWIGGMVGGQGVLHFYLMKKGYLSLYEERFFRAYTSFGDPTLLANYLIMVIPLAGVFYLKAKARVKWGCVSKPTKWAWGSILIVMLTALFLTYSRSAWIALGLTLAGFILIRAKGLKKTIGVLILLISVIGFMAMSQDKYVVNDQMAINNRQRSIYARRDIIWYALKQVKQAPLIGIGPGNFSYFNTDYDKRDMVNTNVPNTYLHTLVISGPLGLGSLLAFLGMVLLSGFKDIHKGRVDKDNFIFSGLAIGVMANLIHGLFENIFYNIVSNWIFGLILGLLVARAEVVSKETK